MKFGDRQSAYASAEKYNKLIGKRFGYMAAKSAQAHTELIRSAGMKA
ncbi:hypothetical protein [Vibrio nigripulchritudo]|nr:hypothetical protein [Vibrio nigripulchritudo]